MPTPESNYLLMSSGEIAGRFRTRSEADVAASRMAEQGREHINLYAHLDTYAPKMTYERISVALPDEGTTDGG